MDRNEQRSLAKRQLSEKRKKIFYPRLMKKEEESRKMSTTASEKQTLKDNFGAK